MPYSLNKNLNNCFRRKFTDKGTGKVRLKAKFSIFCMIFVASAAFCQKPAIPTNLKSAQFFNIPYSSIIIDHSSFSIPYSPLTTTPVTPNFYSANLGFVCKKEIQFEKTTHVPFKFRLGSLQQCNWLEGKRY